MRKLMASAVVWKTDWPMTEVRTKSTWILHPDGRVKTYWNILLVLGMILSLIIAPYQMAFDVNSENFLILELLLDCIFFIDIIFSCFTAFYDDEEVLVKNHFEIIKNYAKSWMIIDIVACFPLHYFLHINMRLNSLLRVTRFKLFLRLIRMTKLFRLIRAFKSNSEKKSVYMALKLSIEAERMLSFLIFVLFYIHIIACSWILIGKLGQDGQNWIFYFGYNNLDNGELYAVSLYWTVTTLTTVGYGDIYAINTNEQVVTTFLMLFGILCYSFTISNISNIFSNLDTREILYNRKLKILDSLSTKVKMPKSFINKLSFALLYENRNNDKEVKTILEDLPSTLSQQLVKTIFAQKLEKNVFFKKLSPSFISYVVVCLYPSLFNENVFVYKAGEYASDVFFTVKGQLGFFVKIQKTWHQFEKIPENSYFGEADLLFSEQKKRLASVKTLERCEVMGITSEKFEEALEKYENESITVHLRAKKRLDYLNSKLTESLIEIDERLVHQNPKYKDHLENGSKSAFKFSKEMHGSKKCISSIKKSIKNINFYTYTILGMSNHLLRILSKSSS